MKTEAQIEIPISAARAEHAVSVENVSFTYLDGDRPALRDVTFAQAAGEMIGVMGGSGAGKSTLAKCLNRIVPEFEGGDFSGVIRINGEQLSHLRVSEVAPKVGMVFQDFEAQLFSTNVAHEVAFAMEQVGMPRAEMVKRIGPALEAVGLKGFEHRDPMSLSGGEKQRLAIASVLALRPSVIVLDEPTTDLDPEGRAEVFDLIRKLRAQNLSLIVIEHESEELRGADRIIVLREGEIAAAGPPGEILARFDLLEECGVRPPGLGRVMTMLGIDAPVASVEQAHAAIANAYPRIADDAHRLKPVPQPVPPESDEEHRLKSVPLEHASLVAVEKVSFSYAGGPRVLDSIDLRIDAGDFLAIVGQNGSGKTTLAKNIVGLLAPQTGRVTLEGKDRSQMRPAETVREVGYVFQNPDHQIFAATVEDEVAFGPRNFGLSSDEVKRRSDEVLEAVGLQDERASDPFLLSKGERQRLAVASVLALRPRVLILDEPTTGLDHREQLRMMKLVRELNEAGTAIVIITHTPWLVAEYARRVVLMRRGAKIFDGGVREFFMHDELLRSSSFRPPEVTELSRRFGTLALTPTEFAGWVKGRA
ncbi:MAG: energy-coupling factor transporter ATPase [Candidatus Binatus sp.]|uniref:ABC transporter ATP-binding protein n=1 Tax=Candidatus Binatus sp. TaxID=2811406 RepID=UPI0027247A7C|nr:ABC transporter ATP-binding protein [Candidatus Binatus sp.]MDO8431450.1 energy-coupling factor transporter ATPase [Candidatus Binatus sp.]